MNYRIAVACGFSAALAACSPTLQSGTAPDGGLPQTALLSTTQAPPGAGHVDAPGTAPHAHDGQRVYGEPGNPTMRARTIEIAMGETDDGRMTFSPSSIQARAGEQILFKIKNSGELDHEFVLATHEENLKHAVEMQKNPDMEHDDPNALRLAAGTNGEILWKFTNSGQFEFACLVPGHRESGMFGTVVAMN